jgi:hypothetical protein
MMNANKSPRHIRQAFDTQSRPISRDAAAKLLRSNRRYCKRVPAGLKFLNWFEPCLISPKPIDHQVNF